MSLSVAVVVATADLSSLSPLPIPNTHSIAIVVPFLVFTYQYLNSLQPTIYLSSATSHPLLPTRTHTTLSSVWSNHRPGPCADNTLVCRCFYTTIPPLSSIHPAHRPPPNTFETRDRCSPIRTCLLRMFKRHAFRDNTCPPPTTPWQTPSPPPLHHQIHP